MADRCIYNGCADNDPCTDCGACDRLAESARKDELGEHLTAANRVGDNNHDVQP